MERYTVKQPTNVLELLRENGVALSAPCGGLGACGKCLVRVNGKEVLACQTVVTEDCVIEVPEETGAVVLEDGIAAGDVPVDPVRAGNLLAVDIGTTTVVAFLLDGHTGEEL
ncbi:MAG: 2Fe-2S iron-sulfur cluster binding domain-containing protein, partial [Clostridia bacterium]|nr:2Fe-2S iron-sulfur cluster binding domain-containing protein [Clostridia bacterium]